MIKLIKRIIAFFKKGGGNTPFSFTETVPLTPRERGTQAKQALNNPVFKEVFDELQKEAFMVWLKTSAKDVESRERLWQQTRALLQVKARLEKYVSDAVYADAVQDRQAREAADQN